MPTGRTEGTRTRTSTILAAKPGAAARPRNPPFGFLNPCAAPFAVLLGLTTGVRESRIPPPG